jgi:hypothetical protein
MTRRLTDVYAQLAADRDHEARLCAELVATGAIKMATVSARKYLALQQRCDMVVTGSPWVDGRLSTSVEA